MIYQNSKKHAEHLIWCSSSRILELMRVALSSCLIALYNSSRLAACETSHQRELKPMEMKAVVERLLRFTRVDDIAAISTQLSLIEDFRTNLDSISGRVSGQVRLCDNFDTDITLYVSPVQKGKIADSLSNSLVEIRLRWIDQIKCFPYNSVETMLSRGYVAFLVPDCT